MIAFFEGPRFSAFQFRDDKDHQMQEMIGEWRPKNKMKTTVIGLMVCLNIGVDPPDSKKHSPCAKLECWIDPFKLPAEISLENIGNQLKDQYELWQSHAKCRHSLDPTYEDTRKLCTQLRKGAKNERALLHYNGHGVPRPTPTGEVWVFNKEYTQYIPLSVIEIHSWLGSPCMYVFDCSNAAILLSFYETIVKSSGRFSTICLFACGANEFLPENSDLPADLFTSCLTTPIKTALHWACLRSYFTSLGTDKIDEIPGSVNERKTPLGELNWIFTSITDTIAWTSFPRDLFQGLFRQDLLVAALMRNFLLAQRIMSKHDCYPVSLPHLPATHQHPLWEVWDHEVERLLYQTKSYLEGRISVFEQSSFFRDQLTAFEVWLFSGKRTKRIPEQLPIVLQILLSQTLRIRALHLLARFLDMGRARVSQALSVQIFPYILRLLQSPIHEFKQVLIFIWGKIMIVDASCQVDLIKEQAHTYFIDYLQLNDAPEHTKATSLLVLALICDHHPNGQKECALTPLMSLCHTLMTSTNGLLRQWSALCFAKLVENNPETKALGLEKGVLTRLLSMLRDPVPEVRCSAIYALSLFVGSLETEQKLWADFEIGRAMLLLYGDGSALVRREVSVCFGMLLYHHKALFSKELSKLYKDARVSSIPNFSTPTTTTTSSANVPLNNNNNNKRIESDSQQTPSSTPTQTTTGATPITPASPNIRTINKDQTTVDQNQLILMLWKMGLRLLEDPCDSVKNIASQCSNSFFAYFLSDLPHSHNNNRQHSNSENDQSHSLPEHIRDPGMRTSVSQQNLSSMGTGDQNKSFFSRHDEKHMPKSSSSAFISSMVHSDENNSNNNKQSHKSKQSNILNSINNSINNSNNNSGNNNNNSKGTVTTVEQPYSPFFDWCCAIMATHPSQRASCLDRSFLFSYFENEKNHENEVYPANNNNNVNNNNVNNNNNGNVNSNKNVVFENEESQPNIYHQFPNVGVPSRKKAYSLNCKYQPVEPYNSSGDMNTIIDSNPNFSSQQAQVDITSLEYQTKIWRQDQYLKSQSYAQKQSKIPISSKFEELICFEGDQESKMTTCLCLHPFQSLLIVADDTDKISVWNYVTGERIRKFSNGQTNKYKITSFRFSNLHSDVLLIVGASDGSIRVWKNFDSQPPNEVILVTCWRAIPLPKEKSTTFNFEWQQRHGHLIAAGSQYNMYVWDCATELCLRDISFECKITCLTSETSSSSLLIAGCVDHKLRMYDVRAHNSKCIEFDEHKSWIVGVNVQEGNEPIMISGSDDGDVIIWDLRKSQKSLRTVKAHNPHLMALSAHNYSSIFVSGSSNQTIKLFGHDGKNISVIRHHYGFMGRRIAPVSCLAFHHFDVTFAAGFTDNIVSVFSAEGSKKKILL